MKNLKYLWLLAVSFCGLLACKHDELSVIKPNENIRPAADFVKNNYETSLFFAAIEKSGYKEQLNGPGPFTVLAPTNAAFNGLGIYYPSDFDRIDADSLKRLIGYHILPRRLRTSDVPANGVDVRYATLEGTELYTSLASLNANGGPAGNTLYFSGALASRKDVVLANGVLHVLEKVMKPAFQTTTAQWLEQHAEYSVFVAGLKKFNLWEQLTTSGPFTIFAPDNDALQEVGINLESIRDMDTSLYKGDLLFGCYLLYNRHFFVNDLRLFEAINSNGRYKYLLKNDTHQMEIFGDYNSDWGYELILRTGGGPLDWIVKTAHSPLIAKNDNLCSNGLVHHLGTGLVSPEQAYKN
ncbi:fasciclin domain-containing protein [Desertivirga xinjiangensis]|uniref:fasciclin domain-containing protein n=1 Tax=Desertivirga xinjiangensis TaxID=539206 RepID=UPI00210E638D|nr:fasciclin domain-containing protein [Pedobacter xinjiangensis]